MKRKSNNINAIKRKIKFVKNKPMIKRKKVNGIKKTLVRNVKVERLEEKKSATKIKTPKLEQVAVVEKIESPKKVEKVEKSPKKTEQRI